MCRWRCAASPPAGRAGSSSGSTSPAAASPRGSGRWRSCWSASSCCFTARRETTMLAAIARLVEMSRLQAAVFTAIVLVLAVVGARFTIANISIDTDVGMLINPNLPWRLQEQKLDRAFPQNVDRLAVVVEAPTPDETEDAAAALAARLAGETDLFKSVRRPDGGDFFKQNGLLFLSKQNVQDFADQIISAQPLIGTLAADPSLRGVFDALDLAAQGAAQGGIDTAGVDTAFTAVDEAAKAALAGKRRRLSWQNLLTGEKPEQNELRRFIQTQPVLDYTALEPARRATDAIHAAARELGLTPENGARVRVTGSPALSDAEFSTLRQGAERSTALSIGLLCLWLLLALRSLRLFLAIVTTLIVGLVACGVFAVGAIGPLNPISAAFAVLFVGLAIDFGIQFSVRYRDERYRVDDLGQALRRTVEGIGGPLVVAAAATAVGFFAFAPTDYTGVRDLGLIAGVGMIIALVLNMTLLPALLTLLRPRRGDRSCAAAPSPRRDDRRRAARPRRRRHAALPALRLQPAPSAESERGGGVDAVRPDEGPEHHALHHRSARAVADAGDRARRSLVETARGIAGGDRGELRARGSGPEDRHPAGRGDAARTDALAP